MTEQKLFNEDGCAQIIINLINALADATEEQKKEFVTEVTKPEFTIKNDLPDEEPVSDNVMVKDLVLAIRYIVLGKDHELVKDHNPIKYNFVQLAMQRSEEATEQNIQNAFEYKPNHTPAKTFSPGVKDDFITRLHINIYEEYLLIKQGKSKLTANQRKYIVESIETESTGHVHGSTCGCK